MDCVFGIIYHITVIINQDLFSASQFRLGCSITVLLLWLLFFSKENYIVWFETHLTF